MKEVQDFKDRVIRIIKRDIGRYKRKIERDKINKSTSHMEHRKYALENLLAKIEVMRVE